MLLVGLIRVIERLKMVLLLRAVASWRHIKTLSLTQVPRWDQVRVQVWVEGTVRFTDACPEVVQKALELDVLGQE